MREESARFHAVARAAWAGLARSRISASGHAWRRAAREGKERMKSPRAPPRAARMRRGGVEGVEDGVGDGGDDGDGDGVAELAVGLGVGDGDLIGIRVAHEAGAFARGEAARVA